MAYAQVGIYGMNKKVGLLSFPQDDNRFDKPYRCRLTELLACDLMPATCKLSCSRSMFAQRSSNAAA